MKNKGFGLLETMLALGLLATSALLLCGVLISGLRLAGQSREAIVASHGAQQIFEHLRGGGCRPPGGNVLFRGELGDSTVAGFPPEPYPQQVLDGRTYVYSVRSTPAPGQPGLYNVLIEVAWGNQHSTRLESKVFVP